MFLQNRAQLLNVGKHHIGCRIFLGIVAREIAKMDDGFETELSKTFQVRTHLTQHACRQFELLVISLQVEDSDDLPQAQNIPYFRQSIVCERSSSRRKSSRLVQGEPSLGIQYLSRRREVAHNPFTALQYPTTSRAIRTQRAGASPLHLTPIGKAGTIGIDEWTQGLSQSQLDSQHHIGDAGRTIAIQVRNRERAIHTNWGLIQTGILQFLQCRENQTLDIDHINRGTSSHISNRVRTCPHWISSERHPCQHESENSSPEKERKVACYISSSLESLRANWSSYKDWGLRVAPSSYPSR